MQDSRIASNSSQRAAGGPRSPLFWALTGLAIGIFWLLFTFVFFTVRQSAALSVVLVVSEVTCPPLLLDNAFAAPVLNAVLYGVVAFILRRILSFRGRASVMPPPSR